MFYNQTLQAITTAVQEFKCDTDLIGDVYDLHVRLYERVRFAWELYEEHSPDMKPAANWLRRANYTIDQLIENMTEEE